MLVLVNGVLAGAEIAIVAVRRTRIEHLVGKGSRAARAVARLQKRPERFLATVQIGITVVGASAGAFGGSTFARDLEPVVQTLPVVRPYSEEVSFAIVVAILSYLSLVLGELVPKSLALRGAERYALLIGRPLLGLSWITRPFVWFLTASSNVLLRAFGDRTSFSETRLSPDELQQLVGEAAEAGSMDPTAGDIASRAIGFAELAAIHVMVPRNRVVALSRRATPAEVQRVLLEQGHARLPVYEGALDNVVGYVTAKDLIVLLCENRLIVLEDALRPAYFVDERTRAVDLLAEMRRRRMQLAIVRDESGAVSGLVTLEDLVEELVGEIFSEHDGEKVESIRPEAAGSVLVRGDVTVHELNRALGLSLPGSDQWSTIAGLCMELAGRIPIAGERLTAPDGTVLEIAEASAKQVLAIRVTTPNTEDAEVD